MARLLSWPEGLGKISYERLTGPRTVGAAVTESLSGFVQTVSSPFGSWRYKLGIQAMQGRKHRLYRQMITALHGGANAVRVPFNDPDVMSFAECGVDVAEGVTNPTAPFSNGENFSNGQPWQISRPPVHVAADAAKGDTIVFLDNEFWGHTIEAGWIGFFPFHFGKYEITEVIAPGQYRIWPPLRKAVVADDFATLNPVMAVRLESEAAGSISRGVAVADAQSMVVVEVTDDIVRQYFTD